MSWRKNQSSGRELVVPELGVVGRIEYCDAVSENPGKMRVEVFADGMADTALMEALDLTDQERATFKQTWEKICAQCLGRMGFQKAQDPPPEPTEG